MSTSYSILVNVSDILSFEFHPGRLGLITDTEYRKILPVVVIAVLSDFLKCRQKKLPPAYSASCWPEPNGRSTVSPWPGASHVNERMTGGCSQWGNWHLCYFKLQKVIMVYKYPVPMHTSEITHCSRLRVEYYY
jgi:hypothetical protein